MIQHYPQVSVGDRLVLPESRTTSGIQEVTPVPKQTLPQVDEKTNVWLYVIIGIVVLYVVLK